MTDDIYLKLPITLYSMLMVISLPSNLDSLFIMNAFIV